MCASDEEKARRRCAWLLARKGGEGAEGEGERLTGERGGAGAKGTKTEAKLCGYRIPRTVLRSCYAVSDTASPVLSGGMAVPGASTRTRRRTATAPTWRWRLRPRRSAPSKAAVCVCGAQAQSLGDTVCTLTE